MANEQNLIPAKKGEVRNPKGKPKGTLNMSTHIQNLLNDEQFSTWVPDPREGWKEYNGAPMEAVIKAQIIKAISGDTKAFDSLGKYGYGTKQEIEHTGGLTVGNVDAEKAKEFKEFMLNKAKS